MFSGQWSDSSVLAGSRWAIVQQKHRTGSTSPIEKQSQCNSHHIGLTFYHAGEFHAMPNEVSIYLEITQEIPMDLEEYLWIHIKS